METRLSSVTRIILLSILVRACIMIMLSMQMKLKIMRKVFRQIGFMMKLHKQELSQTIISVSQVVQKESDTMFLVIIWAKKVYWRDSTINVILSAPILIWMLPIIWRWELTPILHLITVMEDVLISWMQRLCLLGERCIMKMVATAFILCIQSSCGPILWSARPSRQNVVNGMLASMVLLKWISETSGNH